MKPSKRNFQAILYQHFVPFRKLPSPSVGAAWASVLTRLQEEPEVTASEESSATPDRSPLAAQPRWLAVVAVIALLVFAFLHRRESASQSAAAAIIAEGSLRRISSEMKSLVHADDRLSFGETFRSDDGKGAMLSLADGSRVEVRSNSDLSLEPAIDGIRVRLTNGAVILTAVKQRSGRHLYVATKDVTAAVVGTVFFVNADERGSRVAVLEGVVTVRQGNKETTVLPGRQLATDPTLTGRPVEEAIAWSRQAQAHLLLLKRSAVALQITAGQKTEVSREFDVISIRPRAAASGGRSGILPAGFPPACYGETQLDPARLSISNATVFQLIALAYGQSCQRWEQQLSDSDALAGGPKWIREDHFDIQAGIPKGIATYTPAQLTGGHAPQIQMMLQSMLSDRFKLVLERRTKEVPVYVLTVAKGGPKITRGTNTSWQIRTLRTGPDGLPRPSGVSAGPTGGSMERLASSLSNYLGRPVVDRTGIAYEFGFRVDFALPDEDCSSCPTPSAALEDTLGLKLDRSRAPVEVLFVERIEKPSEN